MHRTDRTISRKKIWHTPSSDGLTPETFPFPPKSGLTDVVRWRHYKISRMYSLPNFLNYGATLARARSSAINIRVYRFEPRFKLVRNEKRFDENIFEEDLSTLPFSLVYSTGDPEEQLDIFNSVLKSCRDTHETLPRMKITRSPCLMVKHRRH